MFHRIWFLRLIIFMKLTRISIIMFSRMRNEGAVSKTQYAVENVGGAVSLSYALFEES